VGAFRDLYVMTSLAAENKQVIGEIISASLSDRFLVLLSLSHTHLYSVISMAG